MAEKAIALAAGKLSAEKEPIIDNKLPPKSRTAGDSCDEALKLLDDIRTLAITPAEVAHYDEKFKDLVKLIEGTAKTP